MADDDHDENKLEHEQDLLICINCDRTESENTKLYCCKKCSSSSRRVKIQCKRCLRAAHVDKNHNADEYKEYAINYFQHSEKEKKDKKKGR